MGPTLLLIDGRKYQPFAMHPEDIARGLASKYRFCGQCDRYSVAEHSVYVARHVPPADRLWGLLHDAAEAYLCDMPRPIKRLAYFNIAGRGFVRFDDVETAILLAVAGKFGLAWPMPESVRIADRRACSSEQSQLFRGLVREGDDALWEPYDDPIERLPAELAVSVFLLAFDNIRAGREIDKRPRYSCGCLIHFGDPSRGEPTISVCPKHGGS